jgi:hypothetical protein
MEPVVRDYLCIGLRFGRLVDGFVDCWIGDPALARQVADEPTPDPAGLARQAGAARRALPDSGLDPPRQRFLAAQLRGLECSGLRLAGHPTSFRAEVESYFDVEISLSEPDRYAEAHRELAALLPGPGALADRVATFVERDKTPPEHLGGAIQAVSDALRDRVRATYGLPAGETVAYRIVDNKPWNAFNQYLGGFHSTVELNVDVGHRMAALPLLATHESYPGHHTEHCLKDAGLVTARRQAEHTIALVNTPQCLVAEGTAELALTAVMPGGGWGTWTAGILAEQGLRMEGELAESVLAATMKLLAARQDAAILLHDRGADPDDVVRYLRRWMLVGEERARQMLRFLTDPLWRAYTTTYIEGARLVGAWLAARSEGQPVAERFRRLLEQPLLPSTLRAELNREAVPSLAP